MSVFSYYFCVQNVLKSPPKKKAPFHSQASQRGATILVLNETQRGKTAQTEEAAMKLRYSSQFDELGKMIKSAPEPEIELTPTIIPFMSVRTRDWIDTPDGPPRKHDAMKEFEKLRTEKAAEKLKKQEEDRQRAETLTNTKITGRGYDFPSQSNNAQGSDQVGLTNVASMSAIRAGKDDPGAVRLSMNRRRSSSFATFVAQKELLLQEQQAQKPSRSGGGGGVGRSGNGSGAVVKEGYRYAREPDVTEEAARQAMKDAVNESFLSEDSDVLKMAYSAVLNISAPNSMSSLERPSIEIDDQRESFDNPEGASSARFGRRDSGSYLAMVNATTAPGVEPLYPSFLDSPNADFENRSLGSANSNSSSIPRIGVQDPNVELDIGSQASSVKSQKFLTMNEYRNRERLSSSESSQFEVEKEFGELPINDTSNITGEQLDVEVEAEDEDRLDERSVDISVYLSPQHTPKKQQQQHQLGESQLYGGDQRSHSAQLPSQIIAQSRTESRAISPNYEEMISKRLMSPKVAENVMSSPTYRDFCDENDEKEMEAELKAVLAAEKHHEHIARQQVHLAHHTVAAAVRGPKTGSAFRGVPKILPQLSSTMPVSAVVSSDETSKVLKQRERQLGGMLLVTDVVPTQNDKKSFRRSNQTTSMSKSMSAGAIGSNRAGSPMTDEIDNGADYYNNFMAQSQSLQVSGSKPKRKPAPFDPSIHADLLQANQGNTPSQSNSNYGNPSKNFPDIGGPRFVVDQKPRTKVASRRTAGGAAATNPVGSIIISLSTPNLSPNDDDANSVESAKISIHSSPSQADNLSNASSPQISAMSSTTSVGIGSAPSSSNNKNKKKQLASTSPAAVGGGLGLSVTGEGTQLPPIHKKHKSHGTKKSSVTADLLSQKS